MTGRRWFSSITAGIASRHGWCASRAGVRSIPGTPPPPHRPDPAPAMAVPKGRISRALGASMSPRPPAESQRPQLVLLLMRLLSSWRLLARRRPHTARYSLKTRMPRAPHEMEFPSMRPRHGQTLTVTRPDRWVPMLPRLSWPRLPRLGWPRWRGLAAVAGAAAPRSVAAPRTRSAAPARAAARRTSCSSVAHIGDSTSVDLISSADLPDPAQQLPVRYADVGVRHLRIDASGGRSIVETLPGQVNGYNVARAWWDQGYRGCWVFALGTNDAANIAA